jgi:DNA-binding transcriptional LysR family regulator
MENPLLKYLAFVKTVEKGSFTAAAISMNYAQSSVSKMIADLEKEWGMTLLERSKSGVCLTSSGEQMLPFVRKLLNEYGNLEGQVNRMNGLETGVVRIGTFSSMAINILPDVFARLKADYAGIEYELLLGDYNEIENWLNEGRVDCGFLRLPTVSVFETIELIKDEYKVVLPIEHPLAEKGTVEIEELNNMPFLLLEHGGKTEVSDLLEHYHVKPNIAFTTWEDFAIMAMVEKGLGVSILPDMILRRIPYRLEIRSLGIPYYRTIGLAFKDKKSLSPAVTKFVEYLLLSLPHLGRNMLENKNAERLPALQQA